MSSVCSRRLPCSVACSCSRRCCWRARSVARSCSDSGASSPWVDRFQRAWAEPTEPAALCTPSAVRRPSLRTRGQRPCTVASSVSAPWRGHQACAPGSRPDSGASAASAGACSASVASGAAPGSAGTRPRVVRRLAPACRSAAHCRACSPAFRSAWPRQPRPAQRLSSSVRRAVPRSPGGNKAGAGATGAALPSAPGALGGAAGGVGQLRSACQRPFTRCGPGPVAAAGHQGPGSKRCSSPRVCSRHRPAVLRSAVAVAVAAPAAPAAPARALASRSVNCRLPSRGAANCAAACSASGGAPRRGRRPCRSTTTSPRRPAARAAAAPAGAPVSAGEGRPSSDSVTGPSSVIGGSAVCTAAGCTPRSASCNVSSAPCQRPVP